MWVDGNVCAAKSGQHRNEVRELVMNTVSSGPPFNVHVIGIAGGQFESVGGWDADEDAPGKRWSAISFGVKLHPAKNRG
jgi:hypothetical protein